MDNHRIDITWEGEDRFRLILGLLVQKHGGRRKDKFFTHYIDDPDYGLILMWTNRDNAVKFDKPKGRAELVDFAWQWLQDQDYGPQPDHDGSNGKGWRIFNESWGHVNNDWAAFCAIQPVWAMYGK